MVNRTEWFKRKFAFDMPLWMFPNIVERLRGTPARVEELTRKLPREILIQRDGDKWSIQEQVGHLLDAEELWIARLDDFEAGTETLRPADLQNRKTHEANHNANAIENILAAFRAERMKFVKRLEGYDENFIARTASHPRLQMQMRVIDSAFFVAEHDDHHLSRISELIRSFNTTGPTS
jgi:uncharacterized damage-inducible protein DinB